MSGEAYITGLGIVSPIGVGKDPFLASLRAGRCGLGRLRGLDAAEFRIGHGGEIDELPITEGGELDSGERSFVFALRACREALADAALDAASLPEEATITLGSGGGEMRALEESLGPPEATLPLDLPDPLQPHNADLSPSRSRL